MEITLEVGIAFKEENASEEGIAQKEEVIFQEILFKEEIVVQQSKVFEFVIKGSQGSGLSRMQILQEWRSDKNLPRGWMMTAH